MVCATHYCQYFTKVPTQAAIFTQWIKGGLFLDKALLTPSNLTKSKSIARVHVLYCTARLIDCKFVETVFKVQWLLEAVRETSTVKVEQKIQRENRE